MEDPHLKFHGPRDNLVTASIATLVVLLALFLPTATYTWRQSVDSAHTALSSFTLAEHGTFDLRAAGWRPPG